VAENLRLHYMAVLLMLALSEVSFGQLLLVPFKYLKYCVRASCGGVGGRL
jgi:hypothetical protein